MRISDWSSDVCSSDLGCVACQWIRGTAALPAPGNRLRPRSDHVQLLPHRAATHPRLDRPPAASALDALAAARAGAADRAADRSEEHTSELQSLMRISYAVFCLKNKNPININKHI